MIISAHDIILKNHLDRNWRCLISASLSLQVESDLQKTAAVSLVNQVTEQVLSSNELVRKVTFIEAPRIVGRLKKRLANGNGML